MSAASDGCPDFTVVVEPPLPDIVVVLEPPLPDIVVVLSEVGLVGPAGADGGTGVGLPESALAAHVADPTPHPAYDDLPSLTLLLENGLI